MDASTKITLRGKEFILKYGIKTARALRIKLNNDLESLDKLPFDELIITLIECAIPEVDRHWKNSDELLDMIDEITDPEELHKVITNYKKSMGFIQKVFLGSEAKLD